MTHLPDIPDAVLDAVTVALVDAGWQEPYSASVRNRHSVADACRPIGVAYLRWAAETLLSTFPEHFWPDPTPDHDTPGRRSAAMARHIAGWLQRRADGITEGGARDDAG